MKMTVKSMLISTRPLPMIWNNVPKIIHLIYSSPKVNSSPYAPKNLNTVGNTAYIRSISTIPATSSNASVIPRYTL